MFHKYLVFRDRSWMIFQFGLFVLSLFGWVLVLGFFEVGMLVWFFSRKGEKSHGLSAVKSKAYEGIITEFWRRISDWWIHTWGLWGFFCHSWYWSINQQYMHCSGSMRVTSVSAKPSADDISTAAQLLCSSRLIAWGSVFKEIFRSKWTTVLLFKTDLQLLRVKQC